MHEQGYKRVGSPRLALLFLSGKRLWALGRVGRNHPPAREGGFGDAVYPSELFGLAFSIICLAAESSLVLAKAYFHTRWRRRKATHT